MNYNHHYHAGNFADVLKHIALIICLERLRQKDAPFFVLDTHSGSAKYDLQDDIATKTGEASNGIYNFVENLNPFITRPPSVIANTPSVITSEEKQSTTTSQSFENYLKILCKINKLENIKKPSDIRFYPGSPYIIKSLLRPQDSAIFAEIKKAEFLLLKKNMAGAKNITFLNEDGFNLTKSKLPPIEKRGLILIDPAFEKNSDLISKDYEKIINSLKDAQKRFEHGIYLIWHPIINKENEILALKKFYQEIKDLKFREISHIILKNDDESLKMGACGLFVINPVFGLEEKLSQIFKEKLTIEKIK